MTHLRMKLKNQSKKPLKGKRRQTNYKFAEGESAISPKPTEYTGNKATETKIPKPEKKQEESSSRTKITEKKINGDPKAPKMVTKSSSQLKSVPQKKKVYFSEQYEEYFSSNQTDDVFASGKFSKNNNGIK